MKINRVLRFLVGLLNLMLSVVALSLYSVRSPIPGSNEVLGLVLLEAIGISMATCGWLILTSTLPRPWPRRLSWLSLVLCIVCLVTSFQNFSSTGKITWHIIFSSYFGCAISFITVCVLEHHRWKNP